MEAFNEFTVTMEDRIGALRNEGEVEKGKAKVRRLTEDLRVAKEETSKKTGEAMLGKNTQALNSSRPQAGHRPLDLC